MADGIDPKCRPERFLIFPLNHAATECRGMVTINPLSDTRQRRTAVRLNPSNERYQLAVPLVTPRLRTR